MSPLQRKLNALAKQINELDALVKDEYGRSAFIYFEAEGSAHAMKNSLGDNVRERQKSIIASSPNCKFDCGAW